jgi:molybdopterin converting factor small subunit
MVRVNRASADLETIITDGDRVTVTPTNIKGA